MNKHTSYKLYREDERVWIQENPNDYLWQWEAEYSDGTFLRQFNEDDATFHQIKEIKVEKLLCLHLYSPRLNKRHTMIWDTHWKPIIIYRRAKLVMKVWYDKAHFEKTGKKIEKQVERREYVATIYGYENKVGGIVVKHFNAIMPNQEVISTSDIRQIKMDATPIEEWM